MIPSAINIAAPARTDAVLVGGRDCDVSTNIDATPANAKTRVTMLPSIATTALAMTAMGPLMGIIYFLIDICPKPG